MVGYMLPWFNSINRSPYILSKILVIINIFEVLKITKIIICYPKTTGDNDKTILL